MPEASRRQIAYWHALFSALGTEEQQQALAGAVRELVDDLGLPRLLLDPRATVDQVVRAAPALAPLASMPNAEDPDDLRRQLLLLKSVQNVFGGHHGSAITAEEYADWLDDVRAFERACGQAPGSLLGGVGGRGPGGRTTTGTGGGPGATHADVDQAISEIRKGAGLMAEPEIRDSLQGIEKRLIDKMALHEVLNDPKLSARLKPSMALTAQLLRDKDHLAGPALAAARRLIKAFVDELGDALARDVASASTGPVDRSVPPKRTFRNLDLKRTLWKNLIHWDPEGKRLLVDRLYYRHRSKKLNKTRLIVVVDQSGSMVSAMINCTILASIFAGLPHVEAFLIAYDTQAIDLSPWVHDPFEVLLRTQLGGGTDGTCVIPHLQGHLVDPANTVVAWISDFYDNRELMPWFSQLVRAGVKFVPVGSVSTSGYFSVDAWFRTELKALGTPVLSGSLKSLIRELKAALA